jgi:hypothetical protein
MILQFTSAVETMVYLISKIKSLDYRALLQLEIVSAPALLAQWASIVPLACHLASPRYAFQLVGEAALTHQLSVSIFPRLGVLKNIAALLKEGPQFFDGVGSLGVQEVWDVNWGSTFPCANGAASSIITSFAIKESQRRSSSFLNASCTEETDPKKSGSVGSVITGSSSTPSESSQGRPICMNEPNEKAHNTVEERSLPESFKGQAHHIEEITRSSSLCYDLTGGAPSDFRRWQELHILRVARREPSQTRYRKFIESIYVQNLSLVALSCSVALMGFCHLYGTAAALLISILSKVACRFTHIQKPPSFLANSEKHDACMLVAAHRNATTWYLYIGDRGVVDHLLNKDMVQVEPKSTFLSTFFKLAHVVQILATTFVSANMGWDGGAMVIMMLLDWIVEWEFGDNQLARQWLNKYGVKIETKSFKFSRRTHMICAIQMFSGSRVTQWMDSIIVPCLRRDTLLELLGCPSDSTLVVDHQKRNLTAFDDEQIAQQKSRVEGAVAGMIKAFPRSEDV